MTQMELEQVMVMGRAPRVAVVVAMVTVSLMALPGCAWLARAPEGVSADRAYISFVKSDVGEEAEVKANTYTEILERAEASGVSPSDSYLQAAATTAAEANAKVKVKKAVVNDPRLRLAVKDLIDVKGMVTTAGSEHVARTAAPAARDAACLAIARERGVKIVGKTNLAEFAMGTTGINEYFGTPRNPMMGRRVVPGGSSSGSAVAVASGSADVALGTDTAGSIRVPAACCGIYGLKTTYGLVSLKGVFPLSPKNLDTVGPMAKDVERLAKGMDLLERGFMGKYAEARARFPTARQVTIGRLYLKGTKAEIDEAVDEALRKAGFRVVALSEEFRDRWMQAREDGNSIAVTDGWLSNRHRGGELGISMVTRAALLLGELEYPNRYEAALGRRNEWRAALRQVLSEVDLIALPTMQRMPPRIPWLMESALFEANMLLLQNTVAVNYAGNPAIAIPIPMPDDDDGLTSLQLVGPPKGEAELVNAARLMESKSR